MDPLAVAVLFAGLLAASLAVTFVARFGASLVGRRRPAASRLEPPLWALRDQPPSSADVSDQ